MIVEIDLDELGIMRPLNNWQMNRAKRITNKENRAIAFAAFGIGMSVAQFKRLSEDDKDRVWHAHLTLSSPANIGDH